MNAEELKRLNGEYRVAVEASRNPESDEAAEKASADMIDLRHKLDEALIEDKADREDERRAEAVEARLATAKAVSGIVVPEKPIISRESLKDFTEKRVNTMTFNIPFETRTDITSAASGAYGSYLPSQQWATKLDKFLVAQSGVVAAGPHIIRTADGNQFNWITLVTDAGALAGTEGATATITNPVFGTVPLNSYRVDLFMAISDELLADSSIDLESELSDLAMRAIAIKAASYYNDTDVGTNSSLPQAVALTGVGSTLGKTAAGVDTVTMDELKELYYSVLSGYRANGSWVFNSDLYLETMLMKDDTGNYLVQPSIMSAEPDKLFGKPMHEDAYADVSATGNVGVVLFGDFDQGYIIRYSRGIEVSFSREFAFTSFETTMRAAIWHDAATIDTLAVKHLALA